MLTGIPGQTATMNIYKWCIVSRHLKIDKFYLPSSEN